jgi:hypothetical protein
MRQTPTNHQLCPCCMSLYLCLIRSIRALYNAYVHACTFCTARMYAPLTTGPTHMYVPCCTCAMRLYAPFCTYLTCMYMSWTPVQCICTCPKLPARCVRCCSATLYGLIHGCICCCCFLSSPLDRVALWMKVLLHPC